MKSKLVIVCMFLGLFLGYAQVGIGTTTPDPTSLLEIKSDTAGILIPRMTLVQRDAISDPAPANGLQIYNTTNNTLDIYSNSSWKSFAYSPDSNLVYVYSLSDLPAPESGGITLDETKMYVFSGSVVISPNYININGAGLRGTDPQKDQIISDVANGAVLRSSNKSIYIKELAVVPASSSTTAYDFSDTTGTFFCNIFSGSSVVDAMGPSSGVGTISGFSAITILQNYWNTTNGIKIGGTVGKFTSGYNFIVGISNGAGIELLGDMTANDIDIANNYFIYTGNIGLKVNSTESLDRGRLTTNMFRGVGTPLDGITSAEIGWNMSQNTDIPDTKAIALSYFNEGNSNVATDFTGTTISGFVKVAGTTTSAYAQKFTASNNNRITYDGRRPIVAKISTTINAESGTTDSSYTIAVFKNGDMVSDQPVNTLNSIANKGKFQLSLSTELDLVTTDYIEVYIRRNSGDDTLLVTAFQFNVSD
ncbi:hypothetical protein G3567_00555 [Psychroflexus sp. YR1-1]|uniref:Uncharacterized protein n=1 Tax=Psychroflexus aurantiacus TaxID=2709310 RepID=A0A6B3R1X3_9FLAO|nr:hypothetical protein [Psychroflexus aurantiacus]NEV92635.1 hypothetical protein [Psychroflexus aurantiacus]